MAVRLSHISHNSAHRGLNGRVAHDIGIQILRGDLRPGETLPNEAALGEEYGVSRTVIREAIKSLAAKGLVQSRPKVGTTVQARKNWSLLDPSVLAWKYEGALDEQFLRDLIEVRQLIEPAAAGIGAIRGSDEELENLGQLYTRMEETVEDVEAYIAADMELHAAILASSHNELLQHMNRSVSTALIISRRITTQTPDASKGALPVHRAVVDAIQRRDAQAARATMQELIDEAASDIENIMHIVLRDGRREGQP
jgi:GntR family galactonate operon transcriptional repressor